MYRRRKLLEKQERTEKAIKLKRKVLLISKYQIITNQFHYENQAELNRDDRHPVSGKSRSNQA